MTPRNGSMTPRETPREASGSMTPRSMTPRSGGATPRGRKGKDKFAATGLRAHPMRGQVQGQCVLAEPIKRLKLRIWLKERQRAHRRRQYEAKISRKNCAKNPKARKSSMKQNLLGSAEQAVPSKNSRRLHKQAVTYPLTMASERELNALIDEGRSASLQARDKEEKSTRM